jgi:hypothetical protein
MTKFNSHDYKRPWVQAFTYGCGKYEHKQQCKLSTSLEQKFFSGLCPRDTNTIDFLIFIMEVGRKMRNLS